MLEHGRNGYPTRAPASDWLACSVFRGEEMSRTDIYPSFDDPLFRFRTAGNSPWLNAADREAINAPHRRANVHRRSVMRDVDPTYWRALERARDDALWREPVLRRRHEEHGEPFCTERGGWLPAGRWLRGSQTARWLALRQRFRDINDYETADRIKRVVELKWVSVMDMSDGTMWFFVPGSRNGLTIDG